MFLLFEIFIVEIFNQGDESNVLLFLHPINPSGKSSKVFQCSGQANANGSNDNFFISRLCHLNWDADVDAVVVGLGFARFKGNGTILMVEIEPEPFGRLDVVNADIVLSHPSGV